MRERKVSVHEVAVDDAVVEVIAGIEKDGDGFMQN